MSSIFLAGLLTEMSRLKSPVIKMVCAFVSKASPIESSIVVVVVLLFYVHGKHLRSCRDGQLT